MSDLETMVRDSLNDDRRRLSPPHDASGWVRAAARRQRRRNAVVGAVAASLLAAGAGVVVVPMLNDVEASYVAGLPPADSGLLPWKPAGSLAGDADAVKTAITAWEAQSDDDPAESVYVVAGANMNDTDVVVLQARTDSGAASAALLTGGDDGDGQWTLHDTVDLTAGGDIEALLLPPDIIPTVSLLGTVGTDERPVLLLGPQWREGSARGDASVGWQYVAAGPGFGDAPQWQPLETLPGWPWWAPLRLSDEGMTPPTVVLEPTGRDMGGLAKVLDLPAADEMSAVVASDVSMRLVGREDSSPESLDDIAEVVNRLAIAGAVEVNVLHTDSGAVSVGKDAEATQPTSTLFAAYDSDSLDRPLLVVYATTGDEVTCFSQKPLPAQGLSGMPYVGFGCTLPVEGGPERGIQGNLVWARSLLVEPELGHDVVDISVTMVRPDGKSTTHEMPGRGAGLMVTENADAPVTRYVFTGTETFDSTELDPWVWPGWNESQP